MTGKLNLRLAAAPPLGFIPILPRLEAHGHGKAGRIQWPPGNAGAPPISSRSTPVPDHTTRRDFLQHSAAAAGLGLAAAAAGAADMKHFICVTCGMQYAASE